MAAGVVAAYLLERVRRASPVTWFQGRRRPELSCGSFVPEVRFFAEHRLHRVGELESRALVAWADGKRAAVVSPDILPASEIVRLQAQGARCVTLLAEDDQGLGFALHDLRHLEKFFDPVHHRAQIGFFRMIDRARTSGDSIELDRGLDHTWTKDRDSVLADMNGCPIFLFAVMKMKLKVAVRRRMAKQRGSLPPKSGALDPDELREFDRELERHLDAFMLRGEVREHARSVSARRDSPAAAKGLLEYFTKLGEIGGQK